MYYSLTIVIKQYLTCILTKGKYIVIIKLPSIRLTKINNLFVRNFKIICLGGNILLISHNVKL